MRHPARRVAPLPIAALTLLLSTSPGWADSTCVNPQPEAITEAQSSQSIVDFCGVTDNPCQMIGNQEIFALELNGTVGVDLTCSTTEGTLCVLDAGCTVELGRGSQVRITDVVTTDLRVVLADEEVENPICNAGATVTCTGPNWGETAPPPSPPPVPDRTSFLAGFERPICDEWPRTGPQDRCRMLSATLQPGERVVSDRDGFRVSSNGTLNAWLRGPEDADLDLLLEAWNGSHFEVVDAVPYAGFPVTLSRATTPGRYRWSVAGIRGAGVVDLQTQFRADSSGSGRRVERSAGAAHSQQWGLGVVFDNGSNGRDFLVADVANKASRFTMEFAMRPSAFLRIRGKQEVLRLVDADGKPAAKILLLGKRWNSTLRLELRARSGGRLVRVARLILEPGRWQKYRIEWQAGAGGVARLQRGIEPRLSKPLDNTGQLLNRLLLGSVTRGRTQNDGELHWDSIEAHWER